MTYIPTKRRSRSAVDLLEAMAHFKRFGHLPPNVRTHICGDPLFDTSRSEIRVDGRWMKVVNTGFELEKTATLIDRVLVEMSIFSAIAQELKP